jgi:non-reducing end alpha-L-arabinofuranosidase
MKVQSGVYAFALVFGMVSSGCSSGGSGGNSGGSSGGKASSSAIGGSSAAGGSSSNAGGSSSKPSSTTPGGGAGASGGTTNKGGTTGTGGGGGGTGETCAEVQACAGDVVGTWEVKSQCLTYSGQNDISFLGLTCVPNVADIKGSLKVTGKLTLGSDGKYQDATVTTGSETWQMDKSCLVLSGTKVNCESIGTTFEGALKTYGYETMVCDNASSGGGCTCADTINTATPDGRPGGMGILHNDASTKGNYKVVGSQLNIGDSLSYSFCVKGNELTVSPIPVDGSATPYKGTIVLTKSGTGGTGGSSGTGTGGKGGSGGGGSTGGTVATGGTSKGGTTTGGTSAAGGAGGSSSTTPACTGADCGKEGPCDIYAAANMPCASAYSMIRSLSKSYKGPLFQVRAGSSSTNNTMSGGTTKDIMPGDDGFVDSAKVDEACGSGYCTVSVLYDHSGNGNDLKRGQKGSTAGGAKGAMDDYESCATKGKVKAGGHTVYSLYMNAVEGYRSTVVGKNMPTGQQPQGTYELADGTRKGSACCWDFGNVTTKPATEWAFMDTICLGHTWWGNSKDSAWFGFAIDFEGGVWAGGSKEGDPGYGALDKVGPTNTNNPSMDKAKFALGMIRVSPSEYAIRVADLSTATELKEAWKGGLPVTIGHKGGIVLGVGGDNSNNSVGTFYEGAMVAGYPTNDLEAKIMANIKAVGYEKAE